MFEENWGEFFGISAESMAVLGGWCLWVVVRGESDWRGVFGGDELAVDFKLGYSQFGSSNAWARKNENTGS